MALFSVIAAHFLLDLRHKLRTGAQYRLPVWAARKAAACRKISILWPIFAPKDQARTISGFGEAFRVKRQDVMGGSADYQSE
ncbi:MAG: hypothetical protein ABI548_07105 [Polyangiaceae bacterium]